MRFPAGNAGLVVVIAAVLGTVLIGYVLTVDTSTETATEFEQTADITGLFTTTNQPEYLDYSPPENWTGFRSGAAYWLSGVEYITSVDANGNPKATPYIVPQQDRTALTSSQLTGGEVQTGVLLYYGAHGSAKTTAEPTRLALLDWITSLNLSSTTQTLDIALALNGPVLTRATVNSDGSMTALDTRIVRAVVELNDADKRTVLYGSNDIIEGTWTASQLYFFYDSTVPVGSSVAGVGTTTYVPGDTADWFGIIDMQIEYMDPSLGVKVDSSTAYWENGYDNSKLTIVCQNDGTMDFTIDVDGQTLRFMIGYTFIRATVDGTQVMHQTTGSWQHYAIEIDFLNGVITWHPIVSWTSFLDFTTAPGNSYEMGITGTVTRIDFTQTEDHGDPDAMVDDMHFGIVETQVYMDTSVIVMQNPSITITDYWPSSDGRVQFNGFAMYGDSVTINGQTYSVDDGLITIDGEQYELSSLVVTWLDGSCTAKIGSKEFELGSTASHLVSFGGIWYFTASYWSAETVDKTTYDWNLDTFGLNSQACIVAFLGILVLGTAILHRAQTLGGGDLLIIACAGVIGFIMMDLIL